MKMAERWFNARRNTGFVVPHRVYEGARKIFPACRAYVVGDGLNADEREKDLSESSFASGMQLECRWAPELERDSEPALLAWAACSGHAYAAPVSSMGLFRGSTPIVCTSFEDKISLQGAHEFEVLLHVRVNNTNFPRSLF